MKLLFGHVSSCGTTGLTAKTIKLIMSQTSFQSFGKNLFGRNRIWEILHEVKGKIGIFKLKVFSEKYNNLSRTMERKSGPMHLRRLQAPALPARE